MFKKILIIFIKNFFFSFLCLLILCIGIAINNKQENYLVYAFWIIFKKNYLLIFFGSVFSGVFGVFNLYINNKFK